VIVEEKSNSFKDRLKKIQGELAKNPFISDEDLASKVNVSIHTIRADRRKSGIPEVRKRGKDFSETLFAKAKSLTDQEIVGEILEIQINKEGLSLLDTDETMCLEKTKIVRGHILFAQANTLANAIVDAEIALTGKAEVEFLAPVYAGDRVLAKARVVLEKNRKKEVEIILKTQKKLVLTGHFTIHCLDLEVANHISLINSENNERGNI
jgi:acyl-coenzyme A thioesterase PaaI-like protein